MIADLDVMNEDPDALCHDGGPHDFYVDGHYLHCRRGCGAEVLVAEFDEGEWIVSANDAREAL